MKVSFVHTKNLFAPKIILFNLILLFSSGIYSQTGINTTNPNKDAVLEIYSSTEFPGGLFLPLLELIQTTLADPLQNHVAGMFVYNTNTENDVVPGIYYNNGFRWVQIRHNSIFSSYWTLVGNSGTDPDVNFLGTTDAKGIRIRTGDLERFEFGQAGGLRFYQNRNPTVSWVNDNQTGFTFTPNEDLAFTTDNKIRLRIKNYQIMIAGSEGTQNAPSYSWNHQPNTGIWANRSSGSGFIAFSIDSDNHFQMQNNSQLVQMETNTQSAEIPTYSWWSSKSTGMFMPYLKNIGLSTLGTERIRIPDSHQIYGMFSGTPEFPFYSWYDAPGTGFYTDDTGAFLGFSVDGVDRFRMIGGNQLLKMDFENQSEESPSYSWEAASDTGMYSPTEEESTIAFTVEGSDIALIPDHDQVLATIAGTEDKPTFAFIGSSGTGFWNPELNSQNLGFSTNEIERFRINSSGQLLKVDVENQSSSRPAYSWRNSSATGIYMPKDEMGVILSNTFSITTGFSERLRFPDRYQILGASSGSVVKPFLSWNETPGTGIELVTNESIAFSIDGERKVRIHDRGSILFNQNANHINGRIYSSTNDNENNGIAIMATTAGGSNGVAIKGIAEGNGLAGRFQGNVYHTGVFGPSDHRFKANIHTLKPSEILDKIKKLRPVSYQWKTEEYPELISLKGTTSFGFIAQEFKEIFPELVHSRKRPTDDDVTDNALYYSVDYISMVPLLTAGIQAQNQQLENQNERLEILERKAAQLIQKKNQE